MERMRNELGRAGRRGARILTPDGALSPMDLNPTIEVSAAVIADCIAEAGQFRRRSPDLPGPEPLMDEGMRDAAAGAPWRNTASDTG